MAEESVLSRLHKTSILVTDIANQFWCERQMELNYVHGKKFTKEMAKGKKIHEALQDEVYVPLTIEPVTYKDYMYKTAYENVMSLGSLKANGVCREVRVYGSTNGYRLSGQIDEMKVKGREGPGRGEEDHRSWEAADQQLHEAPCGADHALQEDDGRHTVEEVRVRELLRSLRRGAREGRACPTRSCASWWRWGSRTRT